MKPYNAAFVEGSDVRVADRGTLDNFLATWRLHDPLREEQLQFAGQVARVVSVGYYHGGDVLYLLEAVPGIWHEQCLVPYATS
jgi:hypothetical protein